MPSRQVSLFILNPEIAGKVAQEGTGAGRGWLDSGRPLALRLRSGLCGTGEVRCSGSLVSIDFEDYVNLGALVELAEGFGVTLGALVLGIDFIVDGGR